MRKRRAVGLVAILLIAGCAGIRFGDADVIKASDLLNKFAEDMQIYDVAVGGLEHNDRGVATASSLVRWDRELSRLESSYFEMSAQLDLVEVPEPIAVFRDVAGVWLVGHRSQLELIPRCYSDARDPSACALTGLRKNRDQWIGEHVALNDVLLKAREEGR